jgi:N,N'-diacetyllegionaminate synthase
MSDSTVKVRIGSSYPCFIIAEAGVNHNGSAELAKRLIDAAAASGADAVKFQTFKTENLVTEDAPGADYQEKNLGRKTTQYEMLQRLELSYEVFRELAAYAAAKDILFLSTPFDVESADFLDSLSIPLFKIGSGDLTHHALLQHVGQKGKPVIVSTGMSGLDEVRAAVMALKKVHASIILLHCVSNYPADPKDVNLRAMDTLRQEFDVPVGFSDHTMGIHIALAAVARGAQVIEKHFTLDRTMEGPDHPASLEPDELKQLVYEIREIEAALGSGEKKMMAAETGVAVAARRSWVAAFPLRAGTILRRDMLVFKRPGTGLGEGDLGMLLNRTLIHDMPAGAVIKPQDVVF